MKIQYIDVGRDVNGRRALLAPLAAQWWRLFVQIVKRELGIDLEIIQARGTYAGSASTHADGWAIDLRTWRFSRATVLAIVALARRYGASATWYRTTVGSGPHIHLVVDAGSWTTASSYQTAAVRAGYDGLGPGGRARRDPHPKPDAWLTGKQGVTAMELKLRTSAPLIDTIKSAAKEANMSITDQEIQKIAAAVVSFPTHYSAPLGSVTMQHELINLRRKTDAILALSSALMAEGSEGLPENDRSIITRCVGLAYDRCALEDRLPTLEDFHAILAEQPEAEARDIALRYERYVHGAFSFFNGQSNVGFENRITNIDMHELGQNMKVFGMLTALEMVRNRVMVTPPRDVVTWLYIDEVQSLFGHPTIVDYFARLWREGRKFGLICTGISQNTSHMLLNANARDMVINSDFFLLHKQGPADLEAWTEMLDLSTAERGFIDESIKAGEGLLVAGGIRVPIKDDFPKGELFKLFDTKPAAIAERSMREGPIGGAK